MDKVCRFIKGNKIFDDVFLKTWKLYTDKIINEYSSQGYNLIYSRFECENYLEYSDKIVYEKDLNLYSGARFNNELDARTEVFRLINECEKIVKDLFFLSVIYTYKKNSDNQIVCGIIDANLQFVKIMDAEINDNHIVNVTYYSDIIFAVVSYFDKYHLISSYFPKQKCGGIILGRRCPKVKQLIQDLSNNFDILWGDNTLPMKEQYDYLKNRDVSYIFEIKNHGKLSLRDVYSNETRLINEEVKDCLDNLEQLNNQLLYKLSLKNKVDYEKEQSHYFCEECYQKMDDESLFIKPFNQRANIKKCEVCNKKAYIKLIEVK